jgi:hypothetical protein
MNGNAQGTGGNVAGTVTLTPNVAGNTARKVGIIIRRLNSVSSGGSFTFPCNSITYGSGSTARVLVPSNGSTMTSTNDLLTIYTVTLPLVPNTPVTFNFGPGVGNNQYYGMFMSFAS